jgi:CubicO group peptidase (beta-lactamase class C family)
MGTVSAVSVSEDDLKPKITSSEKSISELADIKAPKIYSTTPAKYQECYSTTANIQIKFSENIKPSTNFNQISIKNQATGKNIKIFKSNTLSTLTIKTSIKDKNTWYLVTIPFAAVSDTAGNKLASTYQFQFRTGPNPAPVPINKILSLFDSYVKSTFSKTGIPGGAIVIVQNDKIKYMKTLGVKDVATQALVTPNTLFYIASCSKAFTSTNIAQLVDAGLMKWDDKVTKYYPNKNEFQLYDNITNRITIRDLLLMRSGMPSECGDINGMLFGDNFSQILYKLRFVGNNTPFRSTYNYQTSLYALAGESAARAKKTSWSSLIKKDLLQPLGMKNATTTLYDYLHSADHTSTYLRLTDGTLKKYGPNGADYDPPSGNIASSINEMANWLKFQIADTGKYNGVQIVSKKELDRTRTGQINASNTVKYGFGWNVWGNNFSLYHSGSNGDGMVIVGVYPTKKMGIVVMLNENNYGKAYAPALQKKFQDLLMYDYTSDPWPLYRDSQVPKPNPPTPPIKASLPISTFSGVYYNSFYGSIKITTKNNRLNCYYGKVHKSYILTHWNGNIFEDKYIPGSLFDFTVIPQRKAQKLTINVFTDYTKTPNTPAVFKRLKKSRH